jgi:hypothetical protein
MKILTYLKGIFQPVKRCSVCSRRLHTAKDRSRGMGAGCYRKEQARLGNNGEPIPVPVNEDGPEER